MLNDYCVWYVNIIIISDQLGPKIVRPIEIQKVTLRVNIQLIYIWWSDLDELLQVKPTFVLLCVFQSCQTDLTENEFNFCKDMLSL